jgi:hypothetical protein
MRRFLILLLMASPIALCARVGMAGCPKGCVQTNWYRDNDPLPKDWYWQNMASGASDKNCLDARLTDPTQSVFFANPIEPNTVCKADPNNKQMLRFKAKLCIVPCTTDGNPKALNGDGTHCVKDGDSSTQYTWYICTMNS